MASRSAYIAGGIVVGAAVVGAVAVAWKVRQQQVQEEEKAEQLRRRQGDSPASGETSLSVQERAISDKIGDVSIPSRRSEEALAAAPRDLILQEEDSDEAATPTVSKQDQEGLTKDAAKAKPIEDPTSSPSSKESAKPFVPGTATSDAALQATTEAPAVKTSAAATSLEESIVVVSKDQAKLEDSFVQVTKPETDSASPADDVAGSSSEPAGEAVTPKRKSRKNRRSKKGSVANQSPTGTATLLDTSLDVSESSEGLTAPTGGSSAEAGTGGVDTDAADNPQDDSHGVVGDSENPPPSSPSPKDLSAIAKSHQKGRKHHHHRGPKSAAAAAAVKEIQSSAVTASGGNKKKSRNNRNKSGSKQASSPHH